MINHVWGLLTHPETEWKRIQDEKESVSHSYAHHVLLLALVPVVCTFIGTTQMGWMIGAGEPVKVSVGNALFIGVVIYAVMLVAVALMGQVVHRLSARVENRPNKARCTVFAGYIATPMFLSGLMGLYPLVWLCGIVGAAGLCYTAYLLYQGIPNFLGVSERDGFIISTSILAVGVLVLEAVLAATVLLWSYGSTMIH